MAVEPSPSGPPSSPHLVATEVLALEETKVMRDLLIIVFTFVGTNAFIFSLRTNDPYGFLGYCAITSTCSAIVAFAALS